MMKKYMLYLFTVLLTVLLLPASASAMIIEGSQAWQELNLTIEHNWKLQQTSASSVKQEPGKTTRLNFNIDVTKEKESRVSGNVAVNIMSYSVPEAVYVDKLDIYLEHPNGESWDECAVIHAVTERTLVTEDGFDVDEEVNVHSCGIPIGDHRWRSEVTLEGDEEPSIPDGYQYEFRCEGCEAGLEAVGLSAASELTLSNAKVGDADCALPSPPGTFNFSRLMKDSGTAVVSVDVYGETEGTFNVTSQAQLVFYREERMGPTSEITVPVTITKDRPPERHRPSHDHASSNEPPVARDDSASTNQGEPVIIRVLDNDSDPDGDPISITNVTSAVNGTVQQNSDGTVTYTPNKDFAGTDTFNYTITDGKAGNSTAKVTVDVTGTLLIPPVAAPPTAGVLVLPPVAAPQIDVAPKRVPAGDPTITVNAAPDTKQVYALLPDGKRLELKQNKAGVWKVSFMVPFKTPDGPYAIKVFTVNGIGTVRQSLYTITIDNSLPIMKMKQAPQADGTYKLQVKPLFNAVSMSYSMADGNQKFDFSRNRISGWWTVIVPAGSGSIAAIDQSGYVVNQALSLAAIPAANASAAQNIISEAVQPLKNLAVSQDNSSAGISRTAYGLAVAALALVLLAAVSMAPKRIK